MTDACVGNGVETPALRGVTVRPPGPTGGPGSTIQRKPMSTQTTQRENATVEGVWTPPRTEHDRYGRPTGARYVECTDCGIEVLTGHTATATHRPGCSQR